MAPNERNILYYPTINVPSNSWLRHSLLYWDHVSSIIPKNVSQEEELSTDIQYLIDEGQFKAIRPGELLNNENANNLTKEFEIEFISIIKSDAFAKYKKSKVRSFSRIRNEKLVPNMKNMERKKSFGKIHSDKISYNIHDFLYDEGLSQKKEVNGWFYFERNTALIYMSLLAKYLATVSKHQTTIGTDHGIYEKFNFLKITDKEAFPVVSINLSGLLPVPQPNVPLEKIIDFKRKRVDNLLHFRILLSDFQKKISESKSKDEVKELSINFQENLTIGIKDLAACMKDAKIVALFKSLKSLINFKSSLPYIAAGVLADEKFHFINLSTPIKIAAIGLSGVFEIGGQYVEFRNQLQSKKRGSPFSYLLEAQRSGIIRKI
jgi:hypothetical protein